MDRFQTADWNLATEAGHWARLRARCSGILAAMISNLTQLGVSLTRRAFPMEITLRWRTIADREYARLQSLAQPEGLEAERRKWPPGKRYLPHVSSISLEAVYPQPEWQRLLRGLETASLRETIEEALGGPAVCDLDRSWVRRQYPIHRRPPGHTPHSWHQDGALLYPFDPTGARAPDADGLLPIITCWLALTPCGLHAPGLEFVRRRVDSLLPPTAFTEEDLRARFPAELFWKPVLEAGDALIFSGGTLHRTQVEPAMRADRTSVELRFFRAKAIPDRVGKDRFVGWASSAPVEDGLPRGE